jgi:hypothetical protein
MAAWGSAPKSIASSAKRQKAYSAVAGARRRTGSSREAAKKLLEPPRINSRHAAKS